MSVLLGRYEFEGPLVNWRGVKKRAGLYAIMSYGRESLELVDVAEAEDLQSVLLDEERQKYWQSKSLGMLTFSVHYREKATRGKRRELVGQILREFDGNCRQTQPRQEVTLPRLGR
jgi:hypothetical protein